MTDLRIYGSVLIETPIVESPHFVAPSIDPIDITDTIDNEPIWFPGVDEVVDLLDFVPVGSMELNEVFIDSFGSFLSH